MPFSYNEAWRQSIIINLHNGREKCAESFRGMETRVEYRIKYIPKKGTGVVCVRTKRKQKRERKNNSKNKNKSNAMVYYALA